MPSIEGNEQNWPPSLAENWPVKKKIQPEKSLTLTLPTRGRPDRLIATVEAALPKMVRDDTRIIIAVDDDDVATIDCLSRLPQDPRVITDIRPREDSLGEKWNRGYLYYPGDVLGYMADYGRWITPAMDQKIIDASRLFPDGIGVVYTQMANFSFPSSQAVTRKLCDKLGWMFPPYFPYWFVDHWIDDIAKMIGRISVANVQQTYEQKLPTQEYREPAFWATFYDCLRLVRRRQAEAIIWDREFDGHHWHKVMLTNNFPMHEFRSQWINDQVRQMPQGASVESGGERYMRLRNAAIVMMRSEWEEVAHDIENSLEQMEPQGKAPEVPFIFSGTPQLTNAVNLQNAVRG